MRYAKKVIFLTPDQLDAQAVAWKQQAEKLPPGEAQRNALRNAFQLQSYAEMKRLLAPRTPRRQETPRRQQTSN